MRKERKEDKTKKDRTNNTNQNSWKGIGNISGKGMGDVWKEARGQKESFIIKWGDIQSLPVWIEQAMKRNAENHLWKMEKRRGNVNDSFRFVHNNRTAWYLPPNWEKAHFVLPSVIRSVSIPAWVGACRMHRVNLLRTASVMLFFHFSHIPIQVLYSTTYLLHGKNSMNMLIISSSLRAGNINKMCLVSWHFELLTLSDHTALAWGLSACAVLLTSWLLLSQGNSFILCVQGTLSVFREKSNSLS